MRLDAAVYCGLLGFLCGLAGFRLGWRLPGRASLPLLEGGFGFLAFSFAWAEAGPPLGAIAVAGWAIGLTAVSLPTFFFSPDRADLKVLRAAPYRRSMIGWLRTGRVPEGGPLATGLAHARQLAIYLLAALLTANFLSLVFGAFLLDYMNAYVASLLRAARRRWLVALLGWNVWSVTRVGAYILLGSASAAPAFAWFGLPASRGQLPPMLALGAAGVLLDVALKLALSARYGRWLGSAVDLEAASDNRALH